MGQEKNRPKTRTVVFQSEIKGFIHQGNLEGAS